MEIVFMKLPLLLTAVLALFIVSCKKDKVSVPVTPQEKILLKDVVLQNLPSPYYHFDYDSTGRISKASYSSGLAMYDISWANNRLQQMQNTVMVNRDLLTYEYDHAGRVALVRIADLSGTVYRRGFFTYDAQNRLAELEWELKSSTAGFEAQQTLTFTYYADGNLEKITDKKHEIPGVQTAFESADVFAEYDTKINVDGFSLLHTANQHLVLLPAVKLQLNNPRRITRTGDGVNYIINNQFNYNSKGWPLSRLGVMTITSGPGAGQAFQLQASFSYYE